MFVRLFRSSALKVLRARNGAVTLEFAFVGTAFLTLVIGAMDFGLFQLREHLVSQALMRGAQELRTGQAQRAEDVEQAFRDRVCEAVQSMMSCSELDYDVRVFAAYPDVLSPDPQYNELGDVTNFDFTAGGPNTIMSVRLAVRHKFILPYAAEAFGGSDGSAVITSVAVIRGEPWPGDDGDDDDGPDT